MPPQKQNEPMSALTHLIATVLTIGGFVPLVIIAAKYGTALHVVTFTIFGATMLILYLMSTIYHFISVASPRSKRVFQILDHSAVYLLIAGTYTPVALIVLPSGWGWSIFGVVWFLAVLGTVLKATALPLPHWISLTLYLAMGWLVVIAFMPLMRSLSDGAFFWLLTGGICYSIGALFFALDKVVPRTRWFGMHEIFHVFVMLGSLAHYVMMLRYIAHIE